MISGTLDRSASLGSPYSVTITATDAGGLSTSRSFTWTVSNPAPVARDDVLATTENASINGSVLASNGNGADSDPDGDPLTVSAVNGVAGAVGTIVAGSNGGSFTIAANGSYSFVPGTAFDDLAAGQTRTTSVTYTISDGQGGTSTATVTVTVTGRTTRRSRSTTSSPRPRTRRSPSIHGPMTATSTATRWRSPRSTVPRSRWAYRSRSPAAPSPSTPTAR